MPLLLLRIFAPAAYNIRAEVIKVEHPERGDDTRAWGPPYAKYVEGTRREGPGESAYFLAVKYISPQVEVELTLPQGQS